MAISIGNIPEYVEDQVPFPTLLEWLLDSTLKFFECAAPVITYLPCLSMCRKI